MADFRTATVTKANLTQLYLAYFGRPPDADGMHFYLSQPTVTIEAVAAAFSASPESQTLSGPTFGAAQVDAIYMNLFNRHAEDDGINYWVAQVNNGTFTPALAAYAIFLGAQNEDKVAVQNKMAIANLFLDHLDTPAEGTGYSGDHGAYSAREFLHTIDWNSENVTAATTDMDAATAAAIRAAEDGGQSFAVSSDAAVYEGNTVTFTLDTTGVAPGVQFGYTITGVQAADVVGGSLTGMAKVGANGKATITVSLVDDYASEGESMTLSIDGKGAEATVDVIDNNHAPTLAGIADQTIAEGESLTATAEEVSALIDALVWDGDEGDTTYVIVTTDGFSYDSRDGEDFEYTPEENFNGEVIFTVTAYDTAGASTERTVTLTVAPVNDEPVLAELPGQTIDEDEAVLLTADQMSALIAQYVSDVDDGDTAYVIVTTEDGFSYDSRDGEAFEYTPEENFNGEVIFTVTAYDQDDVASNEQTLTLTVAPVNDEPVLAELPGQTIDEDEAVLLTADQMSALIAQYVSDVDDGDTAYVIVTTEDGFSYDSRDGEAFEYTPEENFNGEVIFTVTAYDQDDVASNEQTLTLTVAPVNDAPVLAELPGQTIDEDEAVLLTADQMSALIAQYVSDVDDGDTAYVIVTTEDGFSYDSRDGEAFEYTPEENFNGEVIFTVTAYDQDDVASNEQTLTLTVAPVNDEPVLAELPGQTIDEDEAVLLTADQMSALIAQYVSDVDDGDTAYVIVTTEDGFSYDSRDGEAFEYTPEENFNGEVIFTVTAYDQDDVASNEQTLTLTVAPVNDAPVLAGDLAATVDQGASYTITADDLNYTDLDDNEDDVTFTVTGQVNGTVRVGGVAATSFTGAQLAAGDVTFLHDGGATLAASFEVSVEDGDEDASTPAPSTFNFTVNVINGAPTTVADSLITNVGIGATVTIAESWLLANDTDPEGTALDVTGVGSANGGSVSHSAVGTGTGTVTFTDDSTLGGSFTYQATDGTSSGASATVTITNVATSTLNGTAASDIIIGGATNDTLRGGAGNDFMDGGAGTDLLDFSDASAGITFTLVQSATDTVINLSAVGLGTDTYRNMEGVIGSASNDVLTGSALNDRISGGGGNDRITGGAGNDTLTGGTGTDTFVFGSTLASNGNDTVTDFTAGAGGDVLKFFATAASLNGTTIDLNGSGFNTDVIVNAGSTVYRATGSSLGTLSAGDDGSFDNSVEVYNGADAVVLLAAANNSATFQVYRVYDSNAGGGITAASELLGTVSLVGGTNFGQLVAANFG